tara:strand:+ start:245 stop:442 length:198 start_codon:yes stop_codon:yes gene_type:complete
MAEEWHRYIKEDKESVVMRDEQGFYVELYELGRLLEVRKVYSRSESYAEDVAENWVEGIISSPSG